MRFATILAAVGLGLAALACSGCAGRFSRENFDTIYPGQPADAVQRTLGRPDHVTPDHWVYIRREPYYYEAWVHFQDGRVTKKQQFFAPAGSLAPSSPGVRTEPKAPGRS